MSDLDVDKFIAETYSSEIVELSDILSGSNADIPDEKTDELAHNMIKTVEMRRKDLEVSVYVEEVKGSIEYDCNPEEVVEMYSKIAELGESNQIENFEEKTWAALDYQHLKENNWEDYIFENQAN
jgi:hypothetical protein